MRRVIIIGAVVAFLLTLLFVPTSYTHEIDYPHKLVLLTSTKPLWEIDGRETIGYGVLALEWLFIAGTAFGIWHFVNWKKEKRGADWGVVPAAPSPLAPSTHPIQPLPAANAKAAPVPPPQQVAQPLSELEAYRLVAQEFAEGKRDEGLWLKCFAEAEGDENKTKANYTKLRVVELQQDSVSAKQKANIEAEKILMPWRNTLLLLLRTTEDKVLMFEAHASGSQRPSIAELEDMKALVGQMQTQLDSALRQFRNQIVPEHWNAGQLVPNLTADTSASWPALYELALGRGPLYFESSNLIRDAADSINRSIQEHGHHVKLLEEGVASIRAKKYNAARNALLLLGAVRFADLDYAALEMPMNKRAGEISAGYVVGLFVVLALCVWGWNASQSAQPATPAKTETTSATDKQPRVELPTSQQKSASQPATAQYTSEPPKDVLKNTVQAVESHKPQMGLSQSPAPEKPASSPSAILSVEPIKENSQTVTSAPAVDSAPSVPLPAKLNLATMTLEQLTGAARKHDSEAALELARRYKDGTKGFSRDEITSYAWARIAWRMAPQGADSAALNMMNQLDAILSQSEINTATSLLDEDTLQKTGVKPEDISGEWITLDGYRFRGERIEVRKLENGRKEGHFIDEHGRAAWIELGNIRRFNR